MLQHEESLPNSEETWFLVQAGCFNKRWVFGIGPRFLIVFACAWPYVSTLQFSSIIEELDGIIYMWNVLAGTWFWHVSILRIFGFHPARNPGIGENPSIDFTRSYAGRSLWPLRDGVRDAGFSGSHSKVLSEIPEFSFACVVCSSILELE